MIELCFLGIWIEPRKRRQLAKASRLHGPFAFYQDVCFTISHLERGEGSNLRWLTWINIRTSRLNMPPARTSGQSPISFSFHTPVPFSGTTGERDLPITGVLGSCSCEGLNAECSVAGFEVVDTIGGLNVETAAGGTS